MTTTSQRSRQIEECKSLIKQKEEVEKRIQDQESILRINEVDMQTPLIDKDGFPKATLDIYAIRNARALLVRLYNDLKEKMNEIQISLVHVHQTNNEAISDSDIQSSIMTPFAKINGVAPDSPAESAGLQRGDLVLEFGTISGSSFSPLQAIASQLPSYEHKTVKLRIQRDGLTMMMIVIPKPWSGRGLLGCHLVPNDEL